MLKNLYAKSVNGGMAVHVISLFSRVINQGQNRVMLPSLAVLRPIPKTPSEFATL